MTRFPLLFCSIILVGAPLAAQPQEAEIDSLIRRGIQLSLMQDYDSAEFIFTKMIERRPADPAGYFYRAAVVQTRMMDYEDYEEEPRFLNLIETTITLAKRKIRSGTPDAWNYFYIGGGYGYLSFYFSKQQKYWQALRHVKKSVQALDKAVALDSTLYDAYLGIGWYKYYRSKISRHFDWLPFVEDELTSGIELMRQAMLKSHYSKVSAMNGLCWVLHDEGELEAAMALAKTGLNEFRDSRLFLWCAARISSKMQHWQEAALYYEKILRSFDQEKVSSPYNELTCRKNLTELYMKLQQPSLARQHCELARQIRFGPHSKKDYKEQLKEMSKVCEGFPEIVVGENVREQIQ